MYFLLSHSQNIQKGLGDDQSVKSSHIYEDRVQASEPTENCARWHVLLFQSWLDPWGLLASLPKLLGEFLVKERPCLKKGGGLVDKVWLCKSSEIPVRTDSHLPHPHLHHATLGGKLKRSLFERDSEAGCQPQSLVASQLEDRGVAVAVGHTLLAVDEKAVGLDCDVLL